MAEYWDVYDENRNKTGALHRRGDPLGPQEYHLVVEFWTLDGQGRVLLTRRDLRKHFGGLWECTGGSALAGEDSRTAVRRELREETGRVADHWEYLGKIYPSPGIVSEVLYLYLATGLHEEERELDSDEFINLKLMELGTVRKGIADGEITDCKTIAALAMAELKGLIV